MTDLKQKTFDESFDDTADLIAPYKPHLACVLLLDISGAMDINPLKVVNDFKQRIQEIREATFILESTQIDIAIIVFNNSCVQVVQDFISLSDFQRTEIMLTVSGVSSDIAINAGINFAIDKVKERNRLYHSLGTPCFTSWIFMISDRATTDGLSARQRIIEEENKKRLKFWAIEVLKLVELVSKTLEWIFLEDDLAPNFDEFDLYLYKPEKSIPSDW
jgi:von willebrand factor, type A